MIIFNVYCPERLGGTIVPPTHLYGTKHLLLFGLLCAGLVILGYSGEHHTWPYIFSL